MPRKNYTIKQIISKQREAEVLLAQGQTRRTILDLSGRIYNLVAKTGVNTQQLLIILRS
jgi:hypothetical protein